MAKAVTIGLTAFDWRRISFPSTLLFNTASNSAAAVLKADQVEHQVSNKVDRVVQPVHLTHTQALLSTLSTALIYVLCPTICHCNAVDVECQIIDLLPNSTAFG